MANNATIENFIKKVRLAETTKSKDIRITIEEARDLVSSIALVGANDTGISELHKKFDRLIRRLDESQQQSNKPPHIDGGGFKE